MTDVAIRVQNLSKQYPIYENPRDRLKQFILPRLRRLAGSSQKQYYREFWALQDISFEVKKGETVGIIGRNGSGKSTLLQIICGTLSPTSGTVETNGRIAALLELGSGFNPNFTGRENVYMNGALLGLSREEIDEKFDDIAAFADIGDFIEQPVKTYSSGMLVRLAFAVQSQIDPDILIVDEALAVGDAKFQAKCFERLRRLKENGTSILLVTHSSEQIVKYCSTAFLLNDGHPIDSGEPRRVVNRYMDLLFGKERTAIDGNANLHFDFHNWQGNASLYNLSCSEDNFSKQPGYNPYEYRWGDGAATILDFFLSANDEKFPAAVSTGQKITLAVSIKFHREFHRPIFGITIKTKEGITVYGVNSEIIDCEEFMPFGKEGSVVNAKTVFTCRLAPGDYFVSLGVASREGDEIIPHDRRYDSIHLQVRPDNSFFGIVDLGLKMFAKEVVA